MMTNKRFMADRAKNKILQWLTQKNPPRLHDYILDVDLAQHGFQSLARFHLTVRFRDKYAAFTQVYNGLPPTNLTLPMGKKIVYQQWFDNVDDVIADDVLAMLLVMYHGPETYTTEDS